MRSAVVVRQIRRVLCIFPTYAPSFGTFSHAYPLMWRVKAFMPPQGLLLIAAYLPESWPIRFIDENIRKARAADFPWADVVMVSGMHVQAPHIHDIARRARAERENWVGEVEGIDLTLQFLRAKRDETKRLTRIAPVELGMPSLP